MRSKGHSFQVPERNHNYRDMGMTIAVGLIMAVIIVYISNFVLTAILEGWYYYSSHITDEETEDQKC